MWEKRQAKRVRDRQKDKAADQNFEMFHSIIGHKYFSYNATCSPDINQNKAPECQETSFLTRLWFDCPALLCTERKWYQSLYLLLLPGMKTHRNLLNGSESCFILRKSPSIYTLSSLPISVFVLRHVDL